MWLWVSHLDAAHVSPVMLDGDMRNRQVRADDLLFLSLHDFLQVFADLAILIVICHVIPADADGDVCQILFANESFAEESSGSTHVGELIGRGEGC
jgi:hypothetical protein